MREVEAQVIGRDQRARLGHVRAEHLAERGVQQMSPRVMLAQALAARRLHADGHVLALAEAASAHADVVHEELRPAVVRVHDLAAAVAPDQRGGVAHLTTGLGVGRRAIEDHLDLGAFRHVRHATQPIGDVDQGQDSRGRRERLVTDELHGREVGGDALIDRRLVGATATERGARARAFALGLHLLIPLSTGALGDAPPSGLKLFLGQLSRKAVRVVELEQEAPVDSHRHWRR